MGGPIADDRRVHLAREQRLSEYEVLAGQDDDGSGAIAHLLLLGAGELAAGWLTSTSRRIELPSLVMTMPPIGSRIILSIDRGPSVVRIMSLTAFPAAMLLSCAFRPVSR